jgi:hypothetical protein
MCPSCDCRIQQSLNDSDGNRPLAAHKMALSSSLLHTKVTPPSRTMRFFAFRFTLVGFVCVESVGLDGTLLDCCASHAWSCDGGVVGPAGGVMGTVCGEWPGCDGLAVERSGCA